MDVSPTNRQDLPQAFRRGRGVPPKATGKRVALRTNTAKIVKKQLLYKIVLMSFKCWGVRVDGDRGGVSVRGGVSGCARLAAIDSDGSHKNKNNWEKQ